MPQLIVDSIAITIASRSTNGRIGGQPSPEDIGYMVDTCVKGPAAAEAGFDDGLHPCETMPIFAPGSDVLIATRHKARAIAARPQWVQQTYRAEDELPVGRTTPLPKDWKDRMPECNKAARAEVPAGYQCDEYPYASTTLAGPGASLELLDGRQNGMEGTRLGRFYAMCEQEVKIDRQPYLVVPMPVSTAPPTLWTCGL